MDLAKSLLVPKLEAQSKIPKALPPQDTKTSKLSFLQKYIIFIFFKKLFLNITLNFEEKLLKKVTYSSYTFNELKSLKNSSALYPDVF